MSFTTNLFFVFITIFFILWKAFPSKRYPLLSISSLIFYGAWNPWYVPLLLLSSGIAFFASHKIYNALNKNNSKVAKKWLAFGVCADLAILCYFKYFNFFRDSLSDISQFLGFPLHFAPIDILLPVGVSFYTFQSISHTIDVYRKDLVPSRSFWDFLLFESLFPHLVAGPIQKASFLIPQVKKFHANPTAPTPKDKIIAGLDLILRGYVKKLLVADILAPYVNTVFSDLHMYRLLTIGIATFFFTLQIYCDFSGYTDIARGLAKLMGFEFSLNFNYPYFSRSITEFWRRWHISLSSWLRDYLYIPLGGNRGSKLFTYRNLMLTMVLGGLWHGANYTFLLWGFYQGFLLIVHREWSARFSKRKFLSSRFYAGFAWAVTFLLVLGGWYIFRINRISDINTLGYKFLNPMSGFDHRPSHLQLIFSGAFCIIHAIEYFKVKDRVSVIKQKQTLRFAWTLALIFALFLWSPSQDQAFIYFQF